MATGSSITTRPTDNDPYHQRGAARFTDTRLTDSGKAVPPPMRPSARRVRMERRAFELGKFGNFVMRELTSHECDRLIEAAVAARHQAHAPHSHFYVGAAVWTVDDQIVPGCNVENASYSLCLCAERCAVASAIASGHREFLAIAVASLGGVTPCGACRQFVAEFARDIAVVCVDVLTNQTRRFRLAKLLPEAFDASSLPARV